MKHSLRLMSVALLCHGDELLMMKRSPLRTLSPGKWAGIGGHLERDRGSGRGLPKRNMGGNWARPG
ncbi:MAG: hypothetical protein K0R57_6204 [Paenibacillaceae bacterium]|jgi:hypothetical protein|nr:hypothetical protein [Paenibacillaceae bacterium]